MIQSMSLVEAFSSVRVLRNAQSRPAASWRDGNNGPDSRPCAGYNGKYGTVHLNHTPNRPPIIREMNYRMR